ncbi:hypothetical protein IMZ48_46115 [Candidatus Bathyarchaeota archaeon]|nr:hypothetical protein [Candidatus Bathyarchaeota archaeon]
MPEESAPPQPQDPPSVPSHHHHQSAHPARQLLHAKLANTQPTLVIVIVSNTPIENQSTFIR